MTACRAWWFGVVARVPAKFLPISGQQASPAIQAKSKALRCGSVPGRESDGANANGFNRID
jgi:hypothetical protein